MDECLNMNILLEDLSDIAKEYLYDIILEDVNTTSSEEREKNKENIFKRFFNTIIKIMRYIGEKIKAFYKKICKYIATIKDEKCVVKEDCTVPSEVMSGVQSNTYTVIYSLASMIGKVEDKYDNNNVEDWKELFKIKYITIKEGTILQLNIIKRNLLNIEGYNDRLTKKLEALEDKLNTNKDIPRTYFNTVQDVLKSYQTYLITIMNATGDFISNKVSRIVVKQK